MTDSGCDLPQELIDKHEITVVPLTIRFGDEELVDRVELDNKQFWSKMSSSPELPSTAAPSPGAFEQAFLRASENGTRPVVCITLSSKLSATYQSAVAGLGFVGDKADVRVIDSLSATVGEGLLCVEAARLAEAGEDVDTIAKSIEELRSRLTVFGALDTLDNLRKGGRIGAAGAFFGSLLAVKPLITFVDGEVQPESRQRTRTRALSRLAHLATDRAPVERVAIAHSHAQDLDAFLDLLGPIAKQDGIFVSDIGPVIGTHGGPGVIAIALTTPA